MRFSRFVLVNIDGYVAARRRFNEAVVGRVPGRVLLRGHELNEAALALAQAVADEHARETAGQAHDVGAGRAEAVGCESDGGGAVKHASGARRPLAVEIQTEPNGGVE
jgi:hypothetical protein